MNDNTVAEQVAFGTDSFADNPEPRCPCLLLLDTSGSMNGAAINELNAGLVAFKEELSADSLAMKRVEVAVRSRLKIFSIPPPIFFRRCSPPMVRRPWAQQSSRASN